MRKLFSVLAVAGLLVAACGGSDGDSGSGTVATTGETTAETTGATTVDTTGDTTAPTTGDTTVDTTGDTTSGTTGEGGSDDPAPADRCTDEHKGGEMTISPGGFADTLDTYTNGGSNMLTTWVAIPTNPPLMYFDSAAGGYKPLIAESLTANDDNTVWTLKLRDGVTFGNGDPLDADAMIAHLDRNLAPDSTSRLSGGAAAQITDYEKIDDMTVQFTLSDPNGSFAGVLSVGLGQVQDVNLINQVGADAYALDNTGGGVGPYEVTTFAPPEPTVLTAKKDWWGGPVCLDKIIINPIPDIGAAYEAYKKGETDFVSFSRSPEQLKAAEDDALGDFSKQVNNAAFMVMPNAGIGGYDGPMTDVRVRQAVAYAIDPEVINQRAWGGDGLAGKGLVNPASNSLEGTEGLPYDPDKAKALLDEYKQETGWDGTISAIAAGVPQSNQEAAIAVSALLDAVGFKTTLSADLSVPDLVSRVIVDHDFELVASWGIINSEATLANGLRSWVSDNPTNQSGFASPEYDAAITNLDAARTNDERQAGMEALQQVVNDQVPYVVYGADPTATLYRDSLKGLLWHDALTPLVDYVYKQQD